MSTTTTNYKLIKPELTDSADITATNTNWDKIDEELKKAETHTHTAEDVGARPNTWTPTASEVGARPNTWIPTASDVGAVSTMRTLSGIDILAITEEGNFYGINMINVPTSGTSGYITVKPLDKDYRVVCWREYYSYIEYTNVLVGGAWKGWSTQFLPLTGGTLDGDLTILGSTLTMVPRSTGNCTREIGFRNSDGQGWQGSLFAYFNSGVLQRIGLGVGSDGYLSSNSFSVYSDKITFKDKAIYGEHNKPSGSYNGNNSSTARYINTKGIGNMLVINGNGATTFVGAYGAFSIKSDGTTKTFPKNQLYFDIGNKNINMYTADANVNASGYRYDWAVL